MKFCNRYQINIFQGRTNVENSTKMLRIAKSSSFIYTNKLKLRDGKLRIFRPISLRNLKFINRFSEYVNAAN